MSGERPDPEPDEETRERGERIREGRDRRSSRRTSQMSETEQTNQTSSVSQASGTSDSQDGSEEKESQKSGSEQTNNLSETDESNQTTVKDLQHVAMYLDEELADDLDTRFKELDLKYKKVHGEGIEKNRDFYPAVARATINNTTVEEELGLDE